jgi:hypothetical protein
MNHRSLLGVFLFLMPVLAYGDRYGLCEPPECGGSGGGAELLMFITFIALAFGWLGGRDWAMLIYGPTLIGILPVVLLVWMIKDIWPWDYSFKRFMAVAFFGYIVGWLIIWWFSKKKSEPSGG